MIQGSSEILYHVSVAADGTPSPVRTGETLPPEAMTWLHLCASHQATFGRLTSTLGFDESVAKALLSKETRSRVSIRGAGILVILKAMHHLEGASPDDMVGLRLWIEGNKVITVRERDVAALEEMRMLIEGGLGPKSAGEFLAKLFEKVYEDIEPHIEALEDSVAELDDQVTQGMFIEVCGPLAGLGHSAIAFLRHLSPQKTALDTLIGSGFPLLSPRDVELMIESRDRLTRLLEALHEVRDRGAIINDQIIRMQDIELNRSVYKFSLAATIFLPLSFLTSLFGVNLGGIPGVRNDAAFWVLSIVCLLFLVFSILLSKKRKLL